MDRFPNVNTDLSGDLQADAILIQERRNVCLSPQRESAKGCLILCHGNCVMLLSMDLLVMMTLIKFSLNLYIVLGSSLERNLGRNLEIF